MSAKHFGASTALASFLVVGLPIAPIRVQDLVYGRMQISEPGDPVHFDPPSGMSAGDSSQVAYLDDALYSPSALSGNSTSLAASPTFSPDTATDTNYSSFSVNPLYFPSFSPPGQVNAPPMTSKVAAVTFAPAAMSPRAPRHPARPRPTLKQTGCARCYDEVARRWTSVRPKPFFAVLAQTLFRKSGSMRRQHLVASNSWQRQAQVQVQVASK